VSTGSLCPLPQAASSATVQNRAGNRWLLWKIGSIPWIEMLVHGHWRRRVN